MSLPAAPVPTPDADSQVYWDNLRKDVLSVQRCVACGRAQLYFRAMCRHCWSRELSVETASGRGTVYSFTVVHQTGHPALNAETPYVLALITLDEGPRVLARIEGDPAAAAIGDRVHATFHDAGDFRLLYFARD